MMFPLHMEPDDNGTLLVTCPVLPEVATFGTDRVDAWHRGRDAVEEALAARISRWEDFKVPDRGDLLPAFDRKEAVELSSLATSKAFLFIACRESKATRADLTRLLGWHREQVDRLFRFDHATRHDQFDLAFAALGRHLRIEVVAA